MLGNQAVYIIKLNWYFSEGVGLVSQVSTLGSVVNQCHFKVNSILFQL